MFRVTLVAPIAKAWHMPSAAAKVPPLLKSTQPHKVPDLLALAIGTTSAVVVLRTRVGQTKSSLSRFAAALALGLVVDACTAVLSAVTVVPMTRSLRLCTAAWVGS